MGQDGTLGREIDKTVTENACRGHSKRARSIRGLSSNVSNWRFIYVMDCGEVILYVQF
jgi:hypothetical protein